MTKANRNGGSIILKKAFLITAVTVVAVAAAVAGYSIFQSNQYFGKRMAH